MKLNLHIFFILFLLLASVNSYAQQPTLPPGVPAPPSVFDTPEKQNEKTNTPALQNGKTAEATSAEPKLEKYKPYDGIAGSKLNINFPSFMFKQDFLNKLHTAALSGKISKKVEEQTSDNGDSETTAKIVEQPVTFKSFYLSTILMPEDSNWTLWINKQRVRNFVNVIDGMEILKVSKSQIISQYTEVNIGKLQENINAKLLPVDSEQWNYESKDKNIKLNSNTGLIEFVLHTGQSFSVYDMEIFEGVKEDFILQPEKPVDEATSDTISEVGANGEAKSSEAENTADNILNKSSQPAPAANSVNGAPKAATPSNNTEIPQ